MTTAPLTARGPETVAEKRAAADAAAPPPPAEEEAVPTPVARLEAVPDHGMLPVTVGRRQLLLCRFGDHVFAVAAACTHHGAPLAEGRLEGALLRCPWHAVRYDVRTGVRVSVPVCPDLRTFPAEVRDGEVWVTVAARA